MHFTSSLRSITNTFLKQQFIDVINAGGFPALFVLDQTYDGFTARFDRR
jgi:hypothetical protein